MSMSTHVIGIIPADEKYKLMQEIWVSCHKAGICPPQEVLDFFQGSPPNGKGVEVELKGACAVEWSGMDGYGIDVDIRVLPPDVRIIRFCHSLWLASEPTRSTFPIQDRNRSWDCTGL